MGHDETRIARGDADHPRLLDPSVIDRFYASREPDPASLDWDAADGGEGEGEGESQADQLIVGESEAAAAAGYSVSRVSLGQVYPRPWMVLLGAGAWPPRVARTSVCPVCGGTDGADESGPPRGAYCGWCDRLGGVRSSGHPSAQAAAQAAQSRARQVRPGARPFVPVPRHRGLIIVPDRYVPRHRPRPCARPEEPPQSSRSSRPAPPGVLARRGQPPDAASGGAEGCA